MVCRNMLHAERQSLFDKYDEGLLSSLELQTSATQVQQAKSYLLDVKLQYVIQYRLIRYYQGIPLIEQVH